MQIFYFVVMKTYCLRRHEEHILFHNLVPRFVGLCVLLSVLGPTPFRGGQLPCSLFPADSWAWPEQASTALLLPATPVPSAGCLHVALDHGGPQKILCLPCA